MSDWRFYMQLIYVFSILIERAGTAIMVTSLRYLDLRLCIRSRGQRCDEQEKQGQPTPKSRVAKLERAKWIVHFHAPPAR